LSNGCPPRNSCFALHLNQTGAPHEPLFPSSVYDRASARTQIHCFFWLKMLGQLSLKLTPDASSPPFAAPYRPQNGRSYLSPHLSKTSAPDQPHSKYIALHGGGFLQVAVSEAPSQSAFELELLRAGAPDTALRLLSTDPLSMSDSAEITGQCVSRTRA
jgi:hypothetical protein